MSCFLFFDFNGQINDFGEHQVRSIKYIVAPEGINKQCHTNHYHFRKILPGSQAGPWRHLKWPRDGLDQLVRNMSCLENSVRNHGFQNVY